MKNLVDFYKTRWFLLNSATFRQQKTKINHFYFFLVFYFLGPCWFSVHFFCQDFWKIWVVWTHTEMLQTKTCKNMLFFNEVFGCHAFFVIFFWFFCAKKWQHVKKTCKNHVLKPIRICEVMCGCFLLVFQHLCLALTYVKQFFSCEIRKSCKSNNEPKVGSISHDFWKTWIILHCWWPSCF